MKYLEDTRSSRYLYEHTCGNTRRPPPYLFITRVLVHQLDALGIEISHCSTSAYDIYA